MKNLTLVASFILLGGIAFADPHSPMEGRAEAEFTPAGDALRVALKSCQTKDPLQTCLTDAGDTYLKIEYKLKGDAKCGCTPELPGGAKVSNEIEGALLSDVESDLREHALP